MRDAAASSVIQTNLNLLGRPARVVAACLPVAAIFYAGVAATWLPRVLPPTEALDVFIAGALPGLLVTLVLWVARPGLFGPRLRRRLIGVSLSGSAVVPAMIVGF